MQIVGRKTLFQKYIISIVDHVAIATQIYMRISVETNLLKVFGYTAKITAFIIPGST